MEKFRSFMLVLGVLRVCGSGNDHGQHGHGQCDRGDHDGRVQHDHVPHALDDCVH